jgi:diaminohydroxyphosphoribosylaminopyrimidine deaminase/5-amino-6-(5-phosphoribosylamino)uracil reductase
MHLVDPCFSESDFARMDLALRLARRGYGRTSPNPMVGAVLVQSGRIIARGWHRQAGQPHAEIEAMRNAIAQGHSLKGATLYVTLEPCSTSGRTPPCTEAIIASGITDVVCGATDPNPKHAGRGFELLRAAGIGVIKGVRAGQCERLNEAFNHWITRGTPFVTVKAAMSLDGKLATASGQSKWITGLRARAFGMKLRRGSDGILVGVNTVIKDDPKLTLRGRHGRSGRPLRRFVLDSHARTPLGAELLNDPLASATTCIVSGEASPESVSRLAARANVWVAPLLNGRIDLGWVLARLGRDGVVSLLVEGGGEVNASFLLGGHAQRIAFFYAPIILGGRQSTTAVGGIGAGSLEDGLSLNEVAWRKLGQDLLLTARLQPPHAGPNSC